MFLPDTTDVPDRVATLLWSRDGETLLWTPRKEFREEAGTRLMEEAQQLRDQEYRRLLYVALTRAADRLYVCGWKRDDVRPGSWYQLVSEALADIAEPFEFAAGNAGGWSGTGLRIHDVQSAPTQSDRRRAALVATANPLPEWARRPAPLSIAPRVLAPSRSAEAEPPVVSPLGKDAGQRFRRGVLTHRLLQMLPDVEPAERAAASDRYLARAAAELLPLDRAAITRECLAVLAAPTFASLFGPDARAEVPLTGVLGDRVVVGQVDRLHVTEHEVLIVDYKSNRPPPLVPEKVSPVYLYQMAAYRALLRRVYPDRQVRCALLWTETPRLMTLDSALLDLYAPEQ